MNFINLYIYLYHFNFIIIILCILGFKWNNKKLSKFILHCNNTKNLLCKSIYNNKLILLKYYYNTYKVLLLPHSITLFCKYKKML